MSQSEGDAELAHTADEGGRVIGHDEFDPIGTLALIGVYFLILVFMWFFMYFVEFLGNEPTVIGGMILAALGVAV